MQNRDEEKMIRGGAQVPRSGGKGSGEVSHSALPWKACQGGECPCGMIWDGTGEVHVATLHDLNALGKDHYGSDAACTEAVRKANAAFIVTACNAHDDMKEALRGLREWVKRLPMPTEGATAQLIAIGAALSKAESK